ncbi:MAG: hypothetical protein MUF31_10600 [Akkermansiaceae bacterium]|jgi:lysophospholipase L1-like esterase|nr:hypothetical protein [Akkermansiaceae bacterium]
MLRSCLASILLLAPLALPAAAGEKIVTIGDSLTFAYEAEFGPPFSDNYGTTSKNWIEILSGNNPGTGLRKDYFDQGVRDTYSVNLIFTTVQFLFRHEFNWSIPGATANQLRNFVEGAATFSEILAEDPTFSSLLSSTGLTDDDFDVTDLEQQITSEAARFVYFVGGNDVRSVYQQVYLGTSDGQAFMDAYMADATATIDKIQTWNPDLPGVIVAVPHIGITPDVRLGYPFNAVSTGRVTTMLSQLNGRLRALADSRGLGFADIFTPTLRLLNPAVPLTIHGMTFTNAGADPANNNFVWLAGDVSDNFHPHTNAHAVVANIIIEAFNERYQTSIPALTATEILKNLLGRTDAAIDMTFATWMTGYGLTGQPETSDADRDGIPAGVEFGLGLDPGYDDSHLIRTRLTPGGLEMNYTLRLPTTTRVSIDAQISGGLSGFTNILPRPTRNATTERAHAVLPVSGNRGFIRLKSTVAP